VPQTDDGRAMWNKEKEREGKERGGGVLLIQE
jgi:hypothetical protein